MINKQSETITQDNSRPLITVAMPIFNAGKYLRLAVLSIVKQTFTNWELLIIDDGSTDSALDSIANIKDDRIRILRDGENKGLAARLNEAVDLAQGQYFARMDQDDVSYPERFERQLQVLLHNNEVDLLAVRAITIAGNNEFTGILACSDLNERISAKPWRGFYLPHPTWMGKITWFRENHYANPGPFYSEDQELLLRTYEKSRFLMIMEPLFAYRIRDSINWKKLIRTRLTILNIQLQHFMSRGQLYFSVMAMFSFVGRMTLDILKKVSLITYPVIEIQDKKIPMKWQEVLNFIENEIHK